MPCSGVRVELFAFDTAYVERLRAGGSYDREAFCRLLLVQMKLRTRMLASDEAEDLPQEGLVVSEYYRRCRRSLKPMKRFRSIEHYIYRMARMDHGEAIRLGATEKYVLGELPQSLRDEFEEHYFECLECALDLKEAAGFVGNAREVWRQDIAKSAVKVREPVRGRSAWFRPAIAVPAFAALLLVIAYQNAVTIPRIKEQAAHGGGQLFTSSFFLQMAST